MDGGVSGYSYLLLERHSSVQTPFTGCRRDQIESLDTHPRWVQGFPVDYLLELFIVELSAAPMPGSLPLVAFIREHLQRNGPAPFPWFMEQALYHPAYGYYTSARTRIGRQGDYYTNVSVGHLYGQLLASQLVEMWKLLGSPTLFTIVEQGAEDGLLAWDILSAVAEESSQAAACIRYAIVEPIPEKRVQQRVRLEPAFLEKVSWLKDLTELQPVTGAFISNELLDAMPMHLVVYQDNAWSELFVDFSGKDFFFIPMKIESPELVLALQKLPVPVGVTYRTEVNLEAGRWIQLVSTKLERGFVLVIDY
jgi:SAM-dependent MidA family methyltransferase